MEPPFVAQIFWRLLSHQTCSKLRYTSLQRSFHPKSSGRRYYRGTSNDQSNAEDRQTSDWQQRTDISPPDKLEEYGKYPMITATELRSRRERPKRVKMLARDFIDGMPSWEPQQSPVLIWYRQSLQPSLWLLSQASHNLQPGNTLRFQRLSR